MRRSTGVLLVGAATVLAGGSWLAHQALTVRDAARLSEVAGHTYVAALRAGDTRGAGIAGAALTRQVERASAAAHDPLWQVAGSVPVLGDPLRTSTRLAELGDVVVREVLPQAQPAVLAVTAHPLLSAGRVDLHRLSALARAAAHAETVLAPLAQDVRDLPSHLLPPALAAVRDRAERDVPRGLTTLHDAAAVLRVAPDLLGADGPRTYLVAVQNNAESRATGGLIGAYAVLKADHGALRRVAVGTDADLKPAARGVVRVSPEYAAHYEPYGGLTEWFSAGLTPDWPTSASVLRQLWAAQGGGRVDGVIGLDPTALADVLRATGPVTLPGRSLSATNVVDFIERDEYVEFAGRESGPRKLLLAELAAGLFDGLLRGVPSGQALLQQLGSAGATGHLQVWSAHEQEQRALLPLRAAGALPRRPGAFLEVLTQNASGSKADYFVHRSISYRPTGPGRGRVTVTLTSDLDPATASPYALLRLDDPTAPRGSVGLLFSVYGPVGGSVLLDGAGNRGVELDHPWASRVVEVRPGHPLVLTADVTGMAGRLRYRQQPLVRDDELHLPKGSVVG